MQSISAANGREAVRKKRKRRLIIVGIFVVVVVVVVVVVLEAVGWIFTCYTHPVLDRFLSKIQF
jgi:t-SNARE complex subunit (syntaxin)